MPADPMTAIDAWVRLLTAMLNRIPAPFRGRIPEGSIRSWAAMIHDCVQLSASEAAKPTMRCGARGFADPHGRDNGCVSMAGHEGRHGYRDGSGEQDGAA